MQATTTWHRRDSRGGGPRRPPLPALVACTAFVLAAVLALAGSFPPQGHQRRAASHGAGSLAPPRRAADRWTHRPAVSAGRGMPLIHWASDPSPRPCSPVLYAAPDTGMNEGTTNSSLSLRPGPGLRAVMLFVDFPDLHATESTSTIYRRLVPRAQRWFDEVSYGRLQLEVTAVRHWFRLPRRLSSFGLADGISWLEQRALVADAVEAADASVDFAGYQVVYAVAAKGTGIERSTAFHAYAGSGIAADGSELRQGATFFDDTRDEARLAASVLIHETGHILGLPDLYDVRHPGYSSLLRFAGDWDMMSWTDPGHHFLSWEKWKLGWLSSSQLACLEQPGEVTATVTPLERPGGLKAIVVQTGPSRAVVVEARRKLGEDQDLCAEGVLVYSVDASVRSGYGPVRVRAARPDRNAEVRERCGPLHNAPFALGQGRNPRFSDASAGTAMTVLSSGPAGYRVRVTRSR